MRSHLARHLTVGAVLTCGFLSSCATREQRVANAPLTGGLGGAAIGAGIGSLSGYSGSGAVLGFMLGSLGGDAYRANAYSERLIDPVGTARSASSDIKRAQSTRAELSRSYWRLASRVDAGKASGDQHTVLIARAEASRRAEESRMWQLRMKDIGRAMEYARSGRISPPRGGMSEIAGNAGQAARLEREFSDLRKSFARMAK